jgi:hypothetical protein
MGRRMSTTTAATRSACIWRVARLWRPRKIRTKLPDGMIQVRPGVYRFRPETGEVMGLTPYDPSEWANQVASLS